MSFGVRRHRGWSSLRAQTAWKMGVCQDRSIPKSDAVDFLDQFRCWLFSYAASGRLQSGDHGGPVHGTTIFLGVGARAIWGRARAPFRVGRDALSRAAVGRDHSWTTQTLLPSDAASSAARAAVHLVLRVLHRDPKHHRQLPRYLPRRLYLCFQTFPAAITRNDHHRFRHPIPGYLLRDSFPGRWLEELSARFG